MAQFNRNSVEKKIIIIKYTIKNELFGHFGGENKFAYNFRAKMKNENPA